MLVIVYFLVSNFRLTISGKGGRYRRKTHTISRFLAKILPVPISPNVPILSNLPISPKFSLKGYNELLYRRHE